MFVAIRYPSSSTNICVVLDNGLVCIIALFPGLATIHSCILQVIKLRAVGRPWIFIAVYIYYAIHLYIYVCIDISGLSIV